jgi:hypothetical protein
MSTPKLSSLISILFVLLLSSFAVKAQEFTVPASVPSTKEEFVNSEKDMIAAAKWLESTAVGTNMDKRTKVNAWILAWIINSPTVTIEITSAFVKLFDKNPQLNAVWMANYARYVLENNYSTDKVKAHTAGLKSVIACYNLGGDVKKDKALTKVIDADKEGKLEDWVKDAVSK